MDLRIARRYAEALFRVASQSNMVPAIENDLEGVVGLIHSDENFRHLLMSPTIAREAKERVIDKAFADRITGVTMQMLRLLLEKRREVGLELVREEFVRIRRERGRVLYVSVQSAEPLSEAQRSKLIQKLEFQTGKKVEAEFGVSAHLIGGVRVSYENYVLDGTIHGGLTRLKDALRRDLLKQA